VAPDHRKPDAGFDAAIDRAAAVLAYAGITHAPVRPTDSEGLATAVQRYLDGLASLDRVDVLTTGLICSFDPRW
jgi:hypothetical protein